MKAFIIITLALALTACGGGGSEGPTAFPQSPPAAQPQAGQEQCRAPLVQIFGDSTNEQQFDAVQKYMDRIFGPGKVVVQNFAKSGATVADFPWKVLDRSAVILVNYGINDVRAPGADVEQYKQALRQINPTFFETPNPPVDGYAQPMRDVAKELGAKVIDVSAYMRQMGWESYIFDGVHPLQVGYDLITNQMTGPALADAVRARICK